MTCNCGGFCEVCRWLSYEAKKRELRAAGLPPAEYEAAIKQEAERLRL
jgi:hypothetical protein